MRTAFTRSGVCDGGVSLLAQQHIAFLARIAELLPTAKITLLIADQEADDLELGRACGQTPEAFRELVRQSVQAVAYEVAAQGWKVGEMTSVIPKFYERRHVISQEIANDPQLMNRIYTETIQRAAMYGKIREAFRGARFTEGEMIQRTVKTAAEYLVLGEYANTNNALLCNHTTTNLGWYKSAGAAVLHNPIAVY